MFTQLSGPEMFGFSHPTIAKLIQELPNAAMCDKYIFQEYLPSAISRFICGVYLFPLTKIRFFTATKQEEQEIQEEERVIRGRIR